MKRIMMTLSALMIILALQAQNLTNKAIKSGTIIYEETEKLEIELGGDAAQFAHMLPKERSSRKVLYFNDETALYEKDKAPQEENNLSSESDGVMIQMKIVEPDNKTFTDLTKNKQIEQREFMTRMFLIEKDLTVPHWRITNNRKTILDYPCIQAICDLGNDEVLSAWFTPSIPVASGPDTVGNLPGMVLAVDLNNGKKTIVAVSIDPTPVDEDLLIKPKKGKKVTEEKYNAIVAEKMKEMGIENVSGGGHIKTAVIKISR